MLLKKRRSYMCGGGHVASVVITLSCALIAALLVTNRQYVVDQVSVWQFHPTGAITALADRSGMNNEGIFLFYASQPSIEDAQAFNKNCVGKESASTAILGCYNGHNIYVYNVTDPRLDGIQEVTAAHEMLHAAYARMSDSEKNTVDTLLEKEYNMLKDNKDFAERMAFYAQTEPGERDNELHSVIGTEVSNLDPALEAHYKEYFSDRSKVVALNAKYSATFTNLQKQSDQLTNQLTQLGSQIQSDSEAYNNNVNQLNQDIDAFNTQANAGAFTSESSFQEARSTLVTRVDQLNQSRDAINNEIVQYESLKAQLSAVASQSEALNKSINSALAPAPSL